MDSYSQMCRGKVIKLSIFHRWVLTVCRALLKAHFLSSQHPDPRSITISDPQIRSNVPYFQGCKMVWGVSQTQGSHVHRTCHITLHQGILVSRQKQSQLLNPPTPWESQARILKLARGAYRDLAARSLKISVTKSATAKVSLLSS